MIRKGLLPVGLLACGLSAQAQTPILEQHFDAAQSETADKDASGFYEPINLEHGIDTLLDLPVADEWSVQNGVLSIKNIPIIENETNSWRRAIKFRNLNLQEGKSYRVSFKLKGSNVYGEANNKKCKATACLMQGVENADVTIGDALNIENITEEGTTYTKMFYFASKAEQDAKYDAECANKAEYAESNKDEYFLTINVYNPGEFEIDDVVIEEAPVEAVEFGGFAVRVKVGYNTNIAQISNEAGGVAHIANECVKVLVDGAEAEIECVELKNGNLYIYTTEEIDPKADVKVSFTNPGNIEYTGGLSSVGAVMNFEDLTATLNESLGDIENNKSEANSHFWADPEVVAATPSAGSFCLDPSTSEFTVKFSLQIKTKKLIAVMSNGDEVTLKDGTPEEADEVTFVRHGADLAKGGYTLTISGIESIEPYDVAQYNDYVLDFEVGKIQLAQTIYTDLFTTLLEGGNGGQPTNWSIMVGGENWTGGSPKDDNGSACRNLNVTGSDGVERTAFYLCDRDGYTYMMYGDQEDARLTLPAGDIEFTLIAASHDNAGHSVEFRLEDMDGNEVATTNGVCSLIANSQFTSIESSDRVSVKFNNPTERNLILKVHAIGGGYTAVRVLGFDVKSYKITEGDKSDAVEVLASNFAGGNMPAEGSGWLCYDNNNQLAPGSGRNGTSGMLERNFHAKMPSAAFFRECGDNAQAAHRIEYGNGNGVEDGLTLEPGSYEITYYAGTWNDAAGNANKTSKVFMQLINKNTGAVDFNDEHVNIANFENGGACNGQADKIVKSFNTNGGTFSIKAWGTHNTVWGGLTIVKEGSKAAKYTQMLTDALAEAKDELGKSEDAAFDGTTKVQLGEAITKYSAENLDMHTPEEYTAAVNELNTLKDAIKTRRDNTEIYNTTKNEIANFINDMEEKYNALDCVAKLKNTYAKYENVDAVEVVDDAELGSAASTLSNALALSKHMTGNEGVAVLTQQIVELSKQLIALDETIGEDDNDVVAAYNAITDDQDIAANLQKRITAAIYEKLAAGEDIFTKFDEELELEESDPFDATSYIQNPKIYVIAEKHDATNISNYPGWNIEEGQETHGLRPNYGWGGWNGNANHIINSNDMFLGIGWEGDYGVNVWNNVNNLPVGIYDLTIATMDRSGAGDWDGSQNAWPNPERQLSYISIQNGDAEPITKPFNVENLGQYYGFTDDVIEDITLTGDVTASAKVGAYIHAQESFAAIRNVRLSLKGKVEGFDYAAAAKALKDEIATSIKNTAVIAQGEPTSVKYFDLNGVELSAPKGICIKLMSYKNGATVVKKAVVK